MRYKKNKIQVKDGDNVSIYIGNSRRLGKVIKIIEPKSDDSRIWSLEEGGVLIEVEDFGLVSIHLLEDDNDIQFESRE
jgi:hypothetical protein